jgi:hypothetical protein
MHGQSSKNALLADYAGAARALIGIAAAVVEREAAARALSCNGKTRRSSRSLQGQELFQVDTGAATGLGGRALLGSCRSSSWK